MPLRAPKFWIFNIAFWLAAAALLIVHSAIQQIPTFGALLRGGLQGAAGFAICIGFAWLLRRMTGKDLAAIGLVALLGAGGAGAAATAGINALVYMQLGADLGALQIGYFFHTALTHILTLLIWAGLYLAISARMNAAPSAEVQARGGGAAQASEGGPARRIAVERAGRITLLPAAEIEAIRAAGDYIEAITAEGAFLRREALKDIEARLDPQAFIRVHRSAIVNLDAIDSLKPEGRGDYTITLNCGQTIRLSRSYREALAARGFLSA
ncbi:MAG: hypothetical protein Tsb0010_13470 [Parvularculaceae bacterium]